MNPPGKALKRGVTQVTAAPVVTVDKPTPPKPAVRPGERSTAPVFRAIGLLQLVIGIILTGIGAVAWLSDASPTMVLAGAGCLFWSALMYAIAEVLTRLGEISAAVRKRAGE